jgi:hypothetical protein
MESLSPTDEEFYSACSKNIKDLLDSTLLYHQDFNIPFEEKRQLYYNIYESMIYHEKSKLNEKKMLRYVNECFDSFRNIGELVEATQEVINLNNSLHIAKVNMQIHACKDKDFADRIKRDKRIVEKSTENIQRVEARITAEKVMRDAKDSYQNP